MIPGFQLYREAILEGKHAGKKFLVKPVDLVDIHDKRYNSEIIIVISSGFNGNRTNGFKIKGSITNLCAENPRLFDAIMNGEVEMI